MAIPYLTIFQELESRKISYLIVGGFAVNFHNVQRSTVDLDLIVQLEKNNLSSFITLMNDLGFVPCVPVDPTDFLDPDIRNIWITEKNMLVFSFRHSSNPFEIIDIFVEEPKPFVDLYRNRLEVPVSS